MALVVPNTAEILMLQYMLNMIATDGAATNVNGNRVLRLYKNDLTPADTHSLSDLTQSTEAGYAPITLYGTLWSISSTAGITTAVYSQQTFAFSTSATVYGYYVTSVTGGNLLWMERFDNGPAITPTSGGNVKVGPKFSAD